MVKIPSGPRRTGGWPVSHPERGRLAQIIASWPGGEKRHGSGYLVTPGWVLAAAHVVAGAESAGVWLGAPQVLEWESRLAVDTAAMLLAKEADLALLPLRPPLSPMPPDLVLVGRVNRDSVTEIPAVAAGFPRFKLRPAPGPGEDSLREVQYATGLVNPGSNVKTDTFALMVLAAPAGQAELAAQTNPAEPRADPQQEPPSPWQGMSGAAMFACGRLIGVVTEHHPAEGTEVLTIRPLVTLFAAQHADQLAQWRKALPQLPARADQIADVTPPTAAQLAGRRAQVAAARLAPTVLVARDDELSALSAFVTSADRWRWIQGAAFAGKTALLAWFALHPPPAVDLAACFLRRTDGTATAEYALDVLNQQLAVLAERGAYAPAAHLSEQRDDFLDYLKAAAQTARERGHRLVVVVDGLDEDQTPEPDLRVAAWLPDARELPDNAWLLVASRAGVRIDLPADHALRRYVVPLTASEAASQIAEIAEAELRRARQASGLVSQLLGWLTAAASGLSTPELASLLRRSQPGVLDLEVEDTLTDRLGRTVPCQRNPFAAAEQVWAFAHEELLASASRHYAPDLPRLREQLLDWCHVQASRADTSPDGYVAHHYAERLAEARSWTNRWNDLLQPTWAVIRSRSSAEYLPQREDLERLLRAAWRLNSEAVAAGRPAPALAAAVGAAMRLAEIESQIQSTSPALAAVLIESGRWEAARGLRYVTSIQNDDERAVALARVAAALAVDPETMAAVRELFSGLEGDHQDGRGQAALGVARLLVRAGDSQGAAELAEAEATAGRFCAACNAAVGAMSGLTPPAAGWMLMRIRDWSAHMADFDVWSMARRLCESQTRKAAQLTLADVEPAADPGDYLLALLRVRPDDIQDLAAALQLAAPWMSRPALASHFREIMEQLGMAHPWDQQYALADLASVAPAEYLQEILRRSEHMPAGTRMRVLAGATYR